MALPAAPEAAASADSGAPGPSEQLPESREEAVRQAAVALAAQLGGSKKLKASRGFGGGGGKRLSVEVPDPDTSGTAAVRLARDILAQMPRKLAGQFTIAAADEAAAAAAGVPSLAALAARGAPSGGCLLLVAPGQAQLAAARGALAGWQGAAAVVLNPEWDAVKSSAEDTDFILSWEAAYCFQPLAIQAAVVIRKEGAIFRCATGPSLEAAPWRIFLREKDAWVPIGRMAHRPSSQDIEAAMAAAAAVSSPITQGAKMLRGLFEKAGGK
eukprot:scaffold24.g2970.t1